MWGGGGEMWEGLGFNFALRIDLSRLQGFRALPLDDSPILPSEWLLGSFFLLSLRLRGIHVRNVHLPYLSVEDGSCFRSGITFQGSYSFA